VAEIVSIAENNLTESDTLTIGKEMLIPNPRRISQLVPDATAASPSPTLTATRRAAAPPSATPSATAPAPSATPSPVLRPGFAWPAAGPISNYFGPSHPLGIDIDLSDNPTAPIGAAKAGAVTFAGGNPCCSYGYYVVVDHEDGDQTLYANLSAIAVNVGQSLAQGQQLGNAGRSGYATGDQLHFEVRRAGTVVNPISVLP
jgi:murein DD-endopeptidase MepM/ murein hydrolase activator NlpD